jgi:hypothetical protein
VNRTRKSPPSHDGRRRLGRTKMVATVLVAGLAAAGTGTAVVNAAVPTFDVGNLVLFPNRDFITVEGYQEYVGKIGTVTVTRNGTVIGSASHVVEAGDVAFEINHPGGACWGDGTGLKVTPDIRPGDKATISFDGLANAGDTTVQDAYAQKIDYDGDLTLKVTGHVGTSVLHPTQSEQRIVNPALVDTVVAKRDIRAVVGPGLTRAPKGGYSSNLEITGETFTATYLFDNPVVAQIAASGGGTRFMTWQEEDADANRQGLTIAEMEESGGPGMGGCPAGPAEQSAPLPGGAFAARSADKLSLKVNWEPATPQPGAAAVTGYSVEAIGDTKSSTGQQDAVGARVGATGRTALLTGLKATEAYTVEVRSLTIGGRLSEPFLVSVPAPAVPTGDTTAPSVTASPAPALNPSTPVTTSLVTLSSNEPNTAIYYTTDGKPAVEGDLPTEDAMLYTGPIAITDPTTLRWVGIDAAGNTDVIGGFGTYAPASATVQPPAAPTSLVATAGQGSITLKWTSTDTTVKGFTVQAYNAGAPYLDPIDTTDKTITIKPLNLGSYTFTVTAKNAGGDTTSAMSAAVSPLAVTDTISIGTAKWKAGSDFRVTGSGSVVGATIQLYLVNANGSIGAAIPNALTTVTAAVAPAIGSWDIRLRNGNVPPNPGRVIAKSSSGGVTAPFTVTVG